MSGESLPVFRRLDIDRAEWRTDDGRWTLERANGEGPRGGHYIRWNLYETRGDRLHLVASERRLRDVWKAMGE